MKKISIMICLMILVTIIPITSAINMPNIDPIIPKTIDSDPPDWATGDFIGILGLTNAMGKPGSHKGYVAGYYEKEKFNGRFAGVIVQRNATKATGFIGGYIKGPFLIGIIGNLSTKEYKPIVGIGLTNQTHAYFRLMSVIGPTWYIACQYQTY
jgi:hypothetical protein